MALRFAFVLLFSFCAFELGTALPAFPVDEKCGPNAQFFDCGSACVPDCANPQPAQMCTLQCVIGCFCTEGFLKNSKGECVRPQECEARHHDVPVQFPGQAAPKCPDNEEFHACGTACPATCANPHPSSVCTRNCVIGCFCKDGFLRNSRGICVESRACEAAHPNMLFAVPQCQANEEFHSCGTACPATCANPHPSSVCTKNCVIGCFCKEGFLKNAQGVCVESANCGAASRQVNAMPVLPQVCSGDNEEFRQCKGCDGTCKNPNPLCPRNCVPGCACKEGHLRSDAGRCIATRECSAPVQPESFVMLASDPQCGQNEEYRQCKGCDGTCKNPNPLCPRICKPGCACKQGHLRSDEGKCVETRECSAQVQPASFQMLSAIPQCGQNEVFHACGTACPATCANPHPSPVCTRNCVIGCFCQEGYLKNAQGVCVAAANCGAPAAPASLVLAATSVKSEGKCASDREIYTDCGTQLDCLASCGTPLPFLVHGYPQLPPRCSERTCTPGCVCQKPYVRRADGQCVERRECERKNPFDQ